MKHPSVCAGLLLIAFAAGCESKSLGNSVGQAGTGGPGGSGGTGDSNPGGTGGTFSSCDGIGGSTWVAAEGKAGSSGDGDGLLFASGGGPGTGDPCTPEGCPETVATDQGSAWSIAVDAGSLYWTSDRGLVRMPFGGTPTVIAFDSNSTFAIDASSAYWVTRTGGTIMKAPLAGGPALQLTDRSSAVTLPIQGLAVDAAFVYWGEYRPCLGVLMKMGKEGGSPTAISSSNQEAPGPLAVDATNLYASSSRVGVFKIPLTGGAPVVLARDGASRLAVTADRVVWIGNSNGLQTMPLQGGAPVVISTQPWAAMATDSTQVFWGRVGGSVMSTPLAGGADKVLANFQYPRGIAVDSTSVYWTRENGTIMRVPRQ